MNHTLLIPLVGPMQAWGTRSRFDDRDTHLEPTKSGVLGLVCAALGRDRTENIADLAALQFGVRIDAPGRAMTDYQTAQRVARASGGGVANVTSRRHYLSDARYLAAFCGSDASVLANLEDALKNPVWPLSLGRRAFPLTLPPFYRNGSVQIGVGLEDALRVAAWHPLRWGEPRPDSLRLVMEDTSGEGAISDQPISYETRHFGLRPFRTVILSRGDAAFPPCAQVPLVS